MKTILTESPEEAAEFVKRGGIVAFPTETVYGLGADIFDERAIARIFEAKRRPADNPLIAHIGDIGQLTELSEAPNECARRFIEAFFPGPLTIVVEKSRSVPALGTAGLDTIGIRMPRFDVARRFLDACSKAVVAPSANLSGRPSPTTWEAVREDLDGRIDCILQGPASEIGLESTVVDCTGAIPVILRTGSVSIDQLRLVVPATEMNEPVEGVSPRSPGMRHRHYSPLAEVNLIGPNSEINGGPKAAYIGVTPRELTFGNELYCNGVAEYAHELFEFFRACDRMGIATIFCDSVPEQGIGAALMDRLRRAAQK